jgi:hypothetical protein
MSNSAKSLCLGLLGGLLGAWLAVHAGGGIGQAQAQAGSQDRTFGTVSAHSVQLLDQAGKVRALLTMVPEGEPALFFFDGKGHNRLVMGVYAPSEGELPFVVLNDVQQNAAGIFRLFGPHETPVVVLKNGGTDRSIYGLNPGTLDPFLVNLGPGGRKTPIFGSW